MGGRKEIEGLPVRWMVTSVAVGVMGGWLLFALGCQEARDLVEEPPPPVRNVPPFPVAAPELNPANHPTGWQRAPCTGCHTTRLVAGHAGWPEAQCVKCHGSNRPVPFGCGDCHGVPNPQGYPLTGLHALHVLEKAYACGECHASNIHRNGGLDIALPRGGQFVLAAADRDGLPDGVSAPGCTQQACHEARGWRPDTCETCHASPPQNPSHVRHLSVLDAPAQPALSCRDCHAGNQHDDDNTTGYIEVGGNRWIEWDSFTGTCRTSCHGDAQKWDCTPCHGYPPTTGAHPKHASEYQIECRVCHADHEHTVQAALAPFDAAKTARVRFLFQRGSWDKGSATCVNVGCHPNQQWRP
jgi:hypothetical protein